MNPGQVCLWLPCSQGEAKARGVRSLWIGEIPGWGKQPAVSQSTAQRSTGAYTPCSHSSPFSVTQAGSIRAAPSPLWTSEVPAHPGCPGLQTGEGLEESQGSLLTPRNPQATAFLHCAAVIRAWHMDPASPGLGPVPLPISSWDK